MNATACNVEQVKSCVLDMNDKAISSDNLSKCIELYPTAEELPMLKEFQKDNDPKVLPWGRAENFVIQLMNVNQFLLRADCQVTRFTFKEEFDNVAAEIKAVKSCLLSLVNSTALHALFAMVMQIGNFMNFGSSKGAQRGFSLDTLALLPRVDGFSDKSYSLMRFIMESLESDKTLRDDSLEDMKYCDEVSKLSFEETDKQVGDLEKVVKRVSDAVTPAEGQAVGKIGDEQFERHIRIFLVDAQKQVASLREDTNKCVELVKQCIDMYAEKPKSPIAEAMIKFATFRKDMEDARRQNLLAKAKREKAEKRAADAAAKDAAKANAKAKAQPAPEAKAKPQPKAKPAPQPKAKPKALDEAPAESAQEPAVEEGADPDSPKHEEKMRVMKVKIPSKPQLDHAAPQKRDHLSSTSSFGASEDLDSTRPLDCSRPFAGRLLQAPQPMKDDLDNTRRLNAGPGSLDQTRRLSLGPGSQMPRFSVGPGRPGAQQERKTLGPGTPRDTGPGNRPEVLKVSSSGRISIGPGARPPKVLDSMFDSSSK